MSSTISLVYKRNPFLASLKRKRNKKEKSVYSITRVNWFDQEDQINKNSIDTEGSVSGVVK